MARVETERFFVFFERPKPVRSEFLHGKAQKRIADAQALKYGLHKELFDLAAVHADEALDNAVVINGGILETLRISFVFRRNDGHRELAEKVVVRSENRIKIQPVIENFDLRKPGGVIRTGRTYVLILHIAYHNTNRLG